MKVRESGMPPEAQWERLFDVPLILDRLNVGPHVRDVVEVGCGYGTFTVPVATRIAGTLHAWDLEPAMVARTGARLAAAKLGNVTCGVRDVDADGFGVTDASQDACLLFNILHGEAPVRLLAEAARALRAGGRVLVIHWRHDPATPRGPPLAIRPRPEDCIAWGREAGLTTPGGPVDLPPYHYGVALHKS